MVARSVQREADAPREHPTVPLPDARRPTPRPLEPEDPYTCAVWLCVPRADAVIHDHNLRAAVRDERLLFVRVQPVTGTTGTSEKHTRRGDQPEWLIFGEYRDASARLEAFLLRVAVMRSRR